MNARWAGVVVLLLAAGCWGPRVDSIEDGSSPSSEEPNKDKKKPDGKKPEGKKKKLPREDAAAVAALGKFPLVQLTRDASAPGKPVVSVKMFLGGPPEPDSPLKYLAGLSHLRELTINQASDGVPASVVAGLGGLAQLRVLDLSQSRVGDDALEAISKLKGLQVLRLRLTGRTEKGLVHLGKLTGLRELDLGANPGLTGASLRHLAPLAKLRVLLLPNCTGLGDAALGEVGKLTALERLDVAGCATVGDDGVKKLAGLKRLQSLDLTDTSVGDAGVEALAGLPLADLSLSRTRAGGAGLDRLTKLKKLTMREVKAADNAAGVLAKLEGLEQLDLYGSDLSDVGLARLKRLDALSSLAVGNTQITPNGLKELPRFLGLKRVGLSSGSEAKIKPEDIAAFKMKYPRLEVFD